MTPKPRMSAAPVTVTLTLLGHVPSKKNQWKPKQGGVYLDKEANAAIAALMTQARIQWGPRRAMTHPAMDIEFHVRNLRSDRDNKLSCLLDVLQKSGVIHNDNAAWCNGWLVLKPVVVSKQERVIVTLTEAA